MNAVQQQKKDYRQAVAQGRIVYAADLFKGQHRKNFKNKQLEFDDKGQPVWEYGFGLAIDKRALQDLNGGGKIWAEMVAEVQSQHPSSWQQILNEVSLQNKDKFSMKYKDELWIDAKNGKPFSNREGYAGCIVLNLSTRHPIQFFNPKLTGTNVQVSDGIKVGDYVNVLITIDSHSGGLYLNPKMVQLVEYGAPIFSGPNADDVFGSTGPQLAPYIQPVLAAASSPNNAFMQNAMQAPGPAAPMPQAPQFAQQPQQQAPAPQAAPYYGAMPQAPQFAQQPQQQAPAPMPQFGGQPMGNAAQPVMPAAPGYGQQQPQYGGPIQPGPTAPQPAYHSNPQQPQYPQQGMPMPGQGWNGQPQ